MKGRLVFMVGARREMHSVEMNGFAGGRGGAPGKLLSLLRGVRKVDIESKMGCSDIDKGKSFSPNIPTGSTIFCATVRS